MNRSEQVWLVAVDDVTRQRVEALVREDRWRDPAADAVAEVPVTQLAWAVACDPEVSDAVAEHLAQGDGIDDACKQIDDTDLRRVIAAALPRVASE